MGDSICQKGISDVVMDHVLTLLQLSVFLLPVCLVLRDNGCFAFAAVMFESISQRAKVCFGCKTLASKTKQRWPFEVPIIVEVPQVADAPCAQKRELMASRFQHIPTAQGHHVTIAIDEFSAEEKERGECKANEMNELDAEQESATPTSASAGYRSESDVSVIAEGADYREAGGDISLADLRQSLTMFTLEAKDVAPSSGREAKGLTNRNNEIDACDAESARGNGDTKNISVVDAEPGDEFRSLDDVGAAGASCANKQSGLRRRPHQQRSALHAEIRSLKAEVAALQQQVAEQTRSAVVPRLDLSLDASHPQSRGMDLHSNLLTHTPQTQTGHLRPRMKEPTPRLLNGGSEAKETMERQGVVLVGARPAAIRFAGGGLSKYPPASPINGWNDISALARSLAEAVCSNGCKGPDNIATHWCLVCV